MDIKTIRKKYPQYADMSDKELADAIHAKYYSEMPINQFYAKIGLQQAQLQESKIYTEPKAVINKTPQPQVSVNPSQKTNYTEETQTDSSTYIWVIGAILVGAFLFKISKKEDVPRQNESSDTSFVGFLIILSMLMELFQYYANFVYFNEYLQWSAVASVLTIFLVAFVIPFVKDIANFIFPVLSIIAATKVWDWELWIAVLVFFPFVIMQLIGISTSSISTLFNSPYAVTMNL